MDKTQYKVNIEILEDLLGGQPKNKQVYAKYIATKAPTPENGEEEVQDVQEIEERGWTGFPTDDEGVHLWDYQVKGFLTESARCLKTWGNLKQLQDKVKRYVFVSPRKIRLPKTDGVLERPLRAMTAQGPRVTVTRSDLIKAPFQLSFTVDVLEGAGITEGTVKSLLSYGEYMGLGQWRSGSHGRFRTVSIDEI
jgi:hypothetical protein